MEGQSTGDFLTVKPAYVVLGAHVIAFFNVF